MPRERAFVREIRVVGSTVFSPQEIALITAPYVNREVTSEDLEALRLALTLLYVNKGYVNSGAILPDQTVAAGVITYQIIEGRLSDIEVEGNRWFRSSYFNRRLGLAAGPPLNVNDLQERLQLFLEDERIAQLNAQLKPGLRLGDGALDVRVQDRQPFRLTLEFNNYQAPSVGAERGLVTLEDLNVTGNGDVLMLQYGKSDGVDPLLDFRYSLPFTARDTTLILEYRRNTFSVIDKEFKDLDIESNSEIFTVTLRQPVYKTLTDEIALELTGERLSDEETLLGEPFSLSPGAHDGEMVVAALRTAQQWVHRDQRQVIALRSRFSLGIDALGATINNHSDHIPDSRFFAWLGQFQWVRRLPVLDSQVIFRSDLQLAANPLLVLEQMAIGGRYTVRGYQENTMVRDNAFVTSLEGRVPLLRNVRGADYLELAPFVDYGRGWQTKERTPDPQDIASVGIGLRWAATFPALLSIRPQLEVYWGHPLRDVKFSSKNALQDNGIHLGFSISAF